MLGITNIKGWTKEAKFKKANKITLRWGEDQKG